MRSVLFVSKPVAPPWTDGSKNLVRDIARGMLRYEAYVMAPRGVSVAGLRSEPVYSARGSYSPTLRANARVLARLLTGPKRDLWHFFFAPNRGSLRAGALASRLRRVATVHTVASAPDALEEAARYLFADAVVVLSRHTQGRLSAVGVPSERIPPAVSGVTLSAEAVDKARARHGLPKSYVVYPGDLEFSDGAQTFVRAAARDPQGGWVVASRPKTPRAHEARERLMAEARSLGARVLWLGEIEDIHAVIAGAELTVLAANTLHAKIDLPLVLLESLSLGVPVLVAEGTSAAEIVASGGALTVRAGDHEALAALVIKLREEPGHRRELGARGAQWVREECSPGSVAEAYARVYDRVLSARGRDRRATR